MTWVAIYAVALHVILIGLVPASLTLQGAAFDPLTAICHSAVDASGQDQSAPHPLPGYACEHCKLCGAVAPPTPPDAALAALLTPARVARVLRPVSASPARGIVQGPQRARGPPSAT